MKKVGWLGLRVGAAFISISRSISRSSFADPGRSEEPIADAVDIAAPSVVNIQVDIAVARILAGQSSGSGFVLNKEGFIVTNAHVVRKLGAQKKVNVTLWNERKVRFATVHSLDVASDLALLKLVQTPEDLPVAAIGRSSGLRVGQLVVALGSPLLLQNSVTSGIVSAVCRHGSELGMGGGNRMEYIQTDASINSGSSGGPLVDIQGRVVGINVMKAQAEGIGFAIPIDTAMQILTQLMKNGKAARPSLGLKVANFVPEERRLREQKNREFLDSSEEVQVLVMAVEKGSPAEKAGLKEGDLILSVDGQKVRGVRGLLGIIGFDETSRPLNLTVSRQGDELTFSVSTRRADAE